MVECIMTSSIQINILSVYVPSERRLKVIEIELYAGQGGITLVMTACVIYSRMVIICKFSIEIPNGGITPFFDRVLDRVGVAHLMELVPVLMCFCANWTNLRTRKQMFFQTSNVSHTLVYKPHLTYKIADHSGVVGASPVGAAPSTSSFSN